MRQGAKGDSLAQICHVELNEETRQTFSGLKTM